MFVPAVLSLRLSYLTRTEVVDGITDDFRLSFLAGTRNLISGFALCSRWHCTVIEMRSLVLARDDAVGGTVLLFCKCIHYSSVHQECGACTANILAWWTIGCEGRSLLMQAQTNEHHLHSYVLVFLCLYLLMHPAWCMVRFIILARDDCIVGTCSVFGVFTYF